VKEIEKISLLLPQLAHLFTTNHIPSDFMKKIDNLDIAHNSYSGCNLTRVNNSKVSL
jgi:hypothetical protein